MCGIFAYSGPKSNAGQIILDGLKALEYRGYDSWGVAVKKKNGDVYIRKQVGKIGDATLPEINSSIGMGHTRWATHGGVTKANSHPHTDCSGNVIIVHNGIVENFDAHKANLIKKGHKFVSETDTEVIAHLIEDEIARGKKPEKAVVSIYKKLQGLNAIIAFFPQSEEFVALKNGSPLAFGVRKDSMEFFLASDIAAILPHVHSLYFLEDYEILTIKRSGYHLKSFLGRPKDVKFTRINFDSTKLELGQYPHYMLKEIEEQPEALIRLSIKSEREIKNVAEKIKGAFGTYFIGCGTAYYAALAGTYLFSSIAKRHINVSVGSEFSWLADFLKEKSLVVAFSQSGETVDIISSVRRAQEKKAKITAITNGLGSTLYRLADYRLLLNAGVEKCVLATKSFTAKIAIVTLLAETLNGGYAIGKTKIQRASAATKHLLAYKLKIHALAKTLKNKEHIYILGRGLSYPVALESALKIKEGSYIHAEGFAAGELKHGVIALIDKGTPVIVYNPADETYEDTLSSAHEVKARGAHVIGVSSRNNAVYDEFIKVDDCEEATIIPNVVVAQLLGYYLTVERGFDPDKPRNLAKSVTVK